MKLFVSNDAGLIGAFIGIPLGILVMYWVLRRLGEYSDEAPKPADGAVYHGPSMVTGSRFSTQQHGGSLLSDDLVRRASEAGISIQAELEREAKES